MQGSWRDKDKLWIVMEYCGGGSVSDLIQANSNAPLEEEVIAYICKETLAGLAYLHSIGKVRAGSQSGQKPNREALLLGVLRNCSLYGRDKRGLACLVEQPKSTVILQLLTNFLVCPDSKEAICLSCRQPSSPREQEPVDQLRSCLQGSYSAKRHPNLPSSSITNSVV